jgi:hypothetical protein
MDRRRWGGVFGLVFTVLFFFGVFALPNLPDWKVTKKIPDPAQHVASFYNSSGNRIHLIIAAYLIALGGLAFLVFLSAIRARLREAEGPGGGFSEVATGAGLLFVAMLFAAGASFATIAGDIVFGGQGKQLHPNPELSAFLPQLGYPLLLVFGMLSVAVVIVTTSILAVRTGILPRWLAYAGFVVAFFQLFAVVFVPMILFVLWMIAVSVVLLRSEASVAAAA